MAKKPTKITVRSYQVGFGDCFLLMVHYRGDKKKHILIDFGTTAKPKTMDNPDKKDLLLSVAENIRDTCGGKLDAVVVTHRHKDHLSGFGTQGKKNDEGKTRGDIIRDCDPDLVILPWTEEPRLATDAKEPFKGLTSEEFQKQPEKGFVSSLLGMQEVARSIKLESELLSDGKFIEPLAAKTAGQLSFIGQNNIANRSAVENLIKMTEGGKGRYVHAEYDLQKDFDKKFPGVKVDVMGPPTITQYSKVKKQRSSDKNEFWLEQALNKNYWALQAETSKSISQETKSKDIVREGPFPDAPSFDGENIPPYTRWFIRRMRGLRGRQLLNIVRILDKAMNNTSVILLFEIGDQKLLFSGDAQIENWEYCLKDEAMMKKLEDTSLYKVGHHGSRNATPKSLWKRFKNKDLAKDDPMRLKTVISTMHGKHGHTEETAVPRKTLVEALEENSEHTSTEGITSMEIPYVDVEINLEIGASHGN